MMNLLINQTILLKNFVAIMLELIGNRGLKLAEDEYLLFVDSETIITKSMIELLYSEPIKTEPNL